MGQRYSSATKLVVVGSIGAPFGVNGWLKINSYTDPLDNILQFKQWLLIDKQSSHYVSSLEETTAVQVSEVKPCKNIGRFLVLIEGVVDRNSASLLTNKKIAVDRQELPVLESDQYYWTDLVGCNVYSTGVVEKLIGQVNDVFNNDANDIMTIRDSVNRQEHLIPFIMNEVVLKVDLSKQRILVNWN